MANQVLCSETNVMTGSYRQKFYLGSNRERRIFALTWELGNRDDSITEPMYRKRETEIGTMTGKEFLSRGTTKICPTMG